MKRKLLIMRILIATASLINLTLLFYVKKLEKYTGILL